MGNGIGKLGICFADGGAAGVSCRHDLAAVLSSDPLDEGLGHSFCYIPVTAETTAFRSISGASVSANASTPLSTSLLDQLCSYNSFDRASAFESSTSFASIPLQPVPRNSTGSGQLCRFSGGFPAVSGPMERGFLSGPIERAFLSEPIDRGVYSGPMEFKGFDHQQLQRSFSNGGFGGLKPKSKKGSLMRFLRKTFSSLKKIGYKSEVTPASNTDFNMCPSANNLSSHVSLNNEIEEFDGNESLGSQNLQWAQGRAGEDRVHLVISEEHEWVFVGIYDGFNGPDAADFLITNLYAAVHKELKGLLWNDKFESFTSSESTSTTSSSSSNSEDVLISHPNEKFDQSQTTEMGDSCCTKSDLERKRSRNVKARGSRGGVGKKWEENQKKWRGQWDRERLELDRRLKEEHLNHSGSGVNHSDVLKVLSLALKKTEDAYLEVADKMVMENPELALMGSCVLVMLMKGEDLYLMNVGDSRAVLGRKSEPDLWLGKVHRDLERINEETQRDLESNDSEDFDRLNTLASLQLTTDHSTYVEEEVERILNEHPDDASAILNDRVKGSLNVTRAFGAGFLKQPKWNNALLEMFRIDYVGTSPYITCSPSVRHHKLSHKDRFLILSSDGLYQYFTNEEAVSEVELFISSFPEGDPAQHLIEEVLFRAAKKAGMDFHELLEIPQGDRRRYHDDVSVIIISLEGRIWRSSV